MQDNSEMIGFVYSDKGPYFFKELYCEIERIQEKKLPLEGSHYVKKLEMTLSEALDVVVSAIFAIQSEFMEKDHHKDFEAWKKKHPQEDMDYPAWISRSLVYQLDELKLTDINTALRGMGAAHPKEAGTVMGKKKKRGFWNRFRS